MKFADNSIVSNPGSRYRTLYTSKVLSNGAIVLNESGKEDTFEKIQSFESATDMTYILAKLASGDMSVLNVHPGSYGDFTSAPKTLAEALQMKIDADRVYDSLPVEVKKKFDNDRDKFFASAGSDEWLDKLGMTKVLEDSGSGSGSSELVLEPVVPVESKE